MKKKDYCSYVPDGSWGSCCKQHDEDYRNKIISRFEADSRLKDCIRSTGNPVVAWVYFLGVRLLGWIKY